MSVDSRILVETGVSTIRRVQRDICRKLENPDDLPSSLEHVPIKGKDALVLDSEAERNAKLDLEHRLGLHGYRLRFTAEEWFRDTQETKKDEDVGVLADMIDGSDLLEYSLENWCSAVAFFDKERILAACIGMPHLGVFFARYDLQPTVVGDWTRPNQSV